ncbi:MAG: CarD family transcriptional regulator [Desulfuromonas sp.]|nr:MAG: CarD family transcriptional regulator [Desulfuromonas sp.]
MEAVSFKVGDLAVYPTQGVGVIEAIESREMGGASQDFYILRIVDGDMKIMVPVSNADMVGMRSPISKKKISSVYGLLEERVDLGKIASWSRRQREYSEKIKSGDLFEVAEVLRELYQIKEDKELSYGEKKFLEQARRLVVKEVAMVEGAQEEKVVARLEGIFH